MDEKIKEAIQLLRDNGYIVKKLTPLMIEDSDECEASDGSKDCLGCSCSLCIIQ